MIRRAWYAAGFSPELGTGALQGQVIAGRPIVLWRVQSGEMFAFDDDGYREVHIKTDGAVVMARRMLDELEDVEGAAGPPQVRTQQGRRPADVP